MLLNKGGSLSDALRCGAQCELFHLGGLQEETNENDLGSECSSQTLRKQQCWPTTFCEDGYEELKTSNLYKYYKSINSIK